MLQTLVKYPLSLGYNKILSRCKLRVCYSQKLGYKNKDAIKSKIINNLVHLKKSALEGKRIDPRVEKWKSVLLYSDYIQRRSLKFGYKINLKIKTQMEKKASSRKIEKLLNEPVFSVTLKHTENQNPFEHETEEVSSDIEKVDSKPIYMPYAAEDNFKEVEITKIETQPGINDDELVLNKKFKALYEKYLEATKNTLHDNEGMKGKLCIRLGDDLSKIPTNWMTDYETFDDEFKDESMDAYYGTANPDSKVSSVPCGGCGALLHCKDSEIPGYLPSELFENQGDDALKNLTCQRCHFMKFYNTALDVKVSPEEYPKLLEVISQKESAVILMVDLTDFPSSIWPNIGSILGHRTPIYVVGNKIDLLPQDSSTFFRHVTECLRNEVIRMGVNERNIRHVTLISAKSGFGVEELITKLQHSWQYKGDVYLVGCTNVGKSSLFNVLLQSDYCKVQAIDLIQRATTSPWPGTTLKLLKFPLTNPQAWRLQERTQRIRAENFEKRKEEQLRKHQYSLSKDITLATLQGRIGRTFEVPVKKGRGIRENFSMGSHNSMTGKQFGIDESLDEFRQSKWCYDTPGSMQPDQILHLLTTDELMKTLPNRIIIPRTFALQEGHTIFLAGIGRVDFLFVPSFLRCTVFASKQLLLTICETVYADEIYQELLHTNAFGVPSNNPERLKLWPKMRSKDMQVTGIGGEESAADVVLSSAGWMSLTPPEDETISLRAWTPEGRGLFLRTPALLKKSVHLRGKKILNSPAYKTGKGVYMKTI